jgi:RAB protein geranylgeranyltransferase component A
MPERVDTNLFKIWIGQVAQNIEVNIHSRQSAERIARDQAYRANPKSAALAARYGFDAIRSGPA